MKKMTLAVFAVSHALALGAGFFAGIYTLPILTAPPGPDAADVLRVAEDAQLSARFERERAGSDALHWGEGELTISGSSIAFEGRLAPGPDYRLYLAPEFVETEADVDRLKNELHYVGEVKSFDGFLLTLDESIDVGDYTAVVVWCESFGEFITSGLLVDTGRQGSAPRIIPA